MDVPAARAVFLTHLGATLFMTGVIWVVQVVHYRLFDRVGADVFVRYEADHSRLITWIVLPAMTLELLAAVWLAVVRPVPLPGVRLGLLLVVVIWAATFFLSVPAHRILAQGFDQTAYRRLIDTNWLRTVAWSVRSGLALWWTWRLLEYASA